MAQIKVNGEVLDKVYIANAGDISGGGGTPSDALTDEQLRSEPLAVTVVGGGGTGGAPTMPTNAFESGTLAATQFVQAMAGAPLPATAIITSANVSRAIEISSSGTGGPWRLGDYDVNDSVGLVLVIDAAVTHVRFTGAIGDAWSVL